jgi:hypothetical protein
MQTKRWFYFIFTWVIFWFCILILPSLSISYTIISIIAFILWIFFWASSNLIDAYFFNRIWKENKKEYWASTYWLLLSIIIFLVMIISSFISTNFWYNILMYILGSIVFICLIFIYIFNYKKWN